MAERAAVTLQHGIWIDRQELADAGLRDQLEITIEPGEIRIRAAQPSALAKSETTWDVFRSLGLEAQPGRLSNPSTEHDRYLYGAGK